MIKSFPLLLIALIVFCCAKNDRVNDNFIIQNVRVFDGESIVESRSVRVINGIITAIGPNLQPETSEVVIDGTAKTLIPGLINAHVHAGSERDLEEAAQAGVLVLFDLLNTDPVNANRLRKLGEELDKAYYYSSGPVVTVPGSHGTQFGPVPTVSSPSEVEELVRARQKEGSDHIKIIFERGGPNNPMPSIDSTYVRAAAEVASTMGLTTVVHASRQEDAFASIRAGANGLAHMWRRKASPI